MTEKEKSNSSTQTSPTISVTPAPADLVKTLSGASWCNVFPGSQSADDLREPFRQSFYEFFAALEKAGCTLHIESTFRPTQRAYLMHYSWRIVHGKLDPTKIPSMDGVSIEWDHGDIDKSKEAAAEMSGTYRIDHLKIYPALTSRHTEGSAVDMNINWSGDLSIVQKDGTTKQITTEPRDRMNLDLREVGAGYGIIKFKYPADADKPHWSTDGT